MLTRHGRLTPEIYPYRQPVKKHTTSLAFVIYKIYLSGIKQNKKL